MPNNSAQFSHDSAFVGRLRGSERIRRNNSVNATYTTMKNFQWVLFVLFNLSLTGCSTMRQQPVPLSKAIVETAIELAIAAEALEHPDSIRADSLHNLSTDQRRWLRVVRKSYDAGTVKVTYNVTGSVNGSLSVAYPPANAGLGFGVNRSRSNTIEIEFPRKKKK